MKNISISLLLISLLAACASTAQKDLSGSGKTGGNATTKSSESTSAKKSESSTTTSTASRSAASTAQVDPLNDPSSILAKRSVYYPFDVSVVQADDKPVVEAHAKYLSEHPDQKVRLEGNCDERGSDEYNIALGQRRADGVKKLLLVSGVKEKQISTISYGEEKPKATGHDESSWSQNRRTDINYNAN